MRAVLLLVVALAAVSAQQNDCGDTQYWSPNSRQCVDRSEIGDYCNSIILCQEGSVCGDDHECKKEVCEAECGEGTYLYDGKCVHQAAPYPGSPYCPCLPFGSADVDVSELYNDRVGDSCKPWSFLNSPMDCGGPNPPEWCYTKWCYIDPNNCVLDFNPSTDFPDTGLFYSEQACDDDAVPYVPQLVQVEDLQPFPPYTGSARISGEVRALFRFGQVRLEYRLEGTPDACGPDFEASAGSNNCGVRILVAEACRFIDENTPAIFSQTLAESPWNGVTYTSEDGAASGVYAVDVEIPGEYLEGRVMAVYDEDGQVAACARLVERKVDLKFENKEAEFKGSAVVTFYPSEGETAPKVFTEYDFKGVELACYRPDNRERHSCAIAIHSGETCESPGPPLTERDPRFQSRYFTGKYGEARGLVAFPDMTFRDAIGRVMVVYDYSGEQLACVSIREPPATWYNWAKPGEGTYDFPELDSHCIPEGGAGTEIDLDCCITEEPVPDYQTQYYGCTPEPGWIGGLKCDADQFTLYDTCAPGCVECESTFEPQAGKCYYTMPDEYSEWTLYLKDSAECSNYLPDPM